MDLVRLAIRYKQHQSQNDFAINPVEAGSTNSSPALEVQTRPKILVFHSSNDLAALVENLTEYSTDIATNVGEAAALMDNGSYDAIIVNGTLPKLEVFEVLSRAAANLPRSLRFVILESADAEVLAQVVNTNLVFAVFVGNMKNVSLQQEIRAILKAEMGYGIYRSGRPSGASPAAPRAPIKPAGFRFPNTPDGRIARHWLLCLQGSPPRTRFSHQELCQVAGIKRNQLATYLKILRSRLEPREAGQQTPNRFWQEEQAHPGSPKQFILEAESASALERLLQPDSPR